MGSRERCRATRPRTRGAAIADAGDQRRRRPAGAGQRVPGCGAGGGHGALREVTTHLVQPRPSRQPDISPTLYNVGMLALTSSRPTRRRTSTCARRQPCPSQRRDSPAPPADLVPSPWPQPSPPRSSCRSASRRRRRRAPPLRPCPRAPGRTGSTPRRSIRAGRPERRAHGVVADDEPRRADPHVACRATRTRATTRRRTS